MLPDAEDVQPHLLGQDRLFDEVVHPLLRADHVAVERVLLQLRERVDAELSIAAECTRAVPARSPGIGIASRCVRRGGRRAERGGIAEGARARLLGRP